MSLKEEGAEVEAVLTRLQIMKVRGGTMYSAVKFLLQLGEYSTEFVQVHNFNSIYLAWS